MSIFFREGHSLSPCGILLTGPPGAGKRTVAIATSKRLHMHIFEVSCYDLIGESLAATETRLKNVFQRGLLVNMYMYNAAQLVSNQCYNPIGWCVGHRISQPVSK